MGGEFPSVDDWRRSRFRKKGTGPWARHEGFCGECKRLVPLVKRLTAALDRRGVEGMVLVTHKRHVRPGPSDSVSLAECQGSGCLPDPEPEPDFAAALPREHNDPQRAVAFMPTTAIGCTAVRACADVVAEAGRRERGSEKGKQAAS